MTKDLTTGEHAVENDAPCERCGRYGLHARWCEHRAAENDEPRGEHFPTTPVQCACGWRETDPESGTWFDHMSTAPEATAAAWVDAAAIVETYETVQAAATGLRAMAAMLTRVTAPEANREAQS